MQPMQPMQPMMLLMMITVGLLVLAAIGLVVWVIVRSGRGEGQLHRSADNRVLAGVAGGVAERLDVDSTLVRVLWVILGIIPMTAPIALLLYVILVLALPRKPEDA